MNVVHFLIAVCDTTTTANEILIKCEPLTYTGAWCTLLENKKIAFWLGQVNKQNKTTSPPKKNKQPDNNNHKLIQGQ